MYPAGELAVLRQLLFFHEIMWVSARESVALNVCAQWRIQSDWASTHSDWSLHMLHLDSEDFDKTPQISLLDKYYSHYGLYRFYLQHLDK